MLCAFLSLHMFSREDSIIVSEKLSDLTEQVLRFRDERNWGQFHNLKDMAISLSLEASELLEITQWKSGDELKVDAADVRNRVGEELSDILYWTLLVAHDLGINLAEAFMSKLAVNEAKYPVHKARSTSKKYSDL